MTLEFYLGCIGTVFILKYGSILKSVRQLLGTNSTLKELFKCSLCLGFWVGLFWLIVYKISLSLPFILFDFILPFAIANVCWVSDTIVQFIQGLDLLVMSKIDKKD